MQVKGLTTKLLKAEYNDDLVLLKNYLRAVSEATNKFITLWVDEDEDSSELSVIMKIKGIEAEERILEVASHEVEVDIVDGKYVLKSDLHVYDVSIEMAHTFGHLKSQIMGFVCTQSDSLKCQLEKMRAVYKPETIEKIREHISNGLDKALEKVMDEIRADMLKGVKK
jgi:hypothetical protein